MSEATTPAAMTATTVAEELEELFTAELQFRSESPSDAVVAPEGREGVYLGSGDGAVTGRIRGTMSWSFYSGNCLYPQIRAGQKVPDDLHLCTLNPGGTIETEDGARIHFDGKGYGLRSPESYRLGMTIAFRSEDGRYAWLDRVLGVMEGTFDERRGRARWRVYEPRLNPEPRAPRP